MKTTLKILMPRYTDGTGYNHAGIAVCPVCNHKVLFHIDGAECPWCGNVYDDWGELIPRGKVVEVC